MAYVWMPYPSFMSAWSLDGGSLDWLLENVGDIGKDWVAESGVKAMNKKLNEINEKLLPSGLHDEYCDDEPCALFWFKRSVDAVAFKLRWL